jgi:hypothetical protein
MVHITYVGHNTMINEQLELDGGIAARCIRDLGLEVTIVELAEAGALYAKHGPQHSKHMKNRCPLQVLHIARYHFR